jgi:hypothetical protein
MIKKLVLLLFVISALASNFLIIPSTYASTSAPANCSDKLPTNYLSRTHAVEPSIDFASSTDSVAIVQTDDMDSDYVLVLYQPSENAGNGIKFIQNDNPAQEYQRFKIQGTYDSGNEAVYLSLSGNNQDYGFSGGNGYFAARNSVEYNTSCVVGTHNVGYSSNYGSHYGAIQGQTEECDLLDVACNVRALGASIATGFSNLTDALLAGIQALFVPSQNAFHDFFDSMSTFFTTKFGFLAYPITFMVNLFGAVTTWHHIGSQYSTITCIVSLPGNFFGTDHLSFNYCAIENTLPGVWTAAQLLIQASTVLMLFYAFKRKYDEVIRA